MAATVDTERLTDGFRLRATTAEVESWKIAAEAEGISVSEYVRRCASSAPTRADAIRAHAAVAAAIEAGTLVRGACEVCDELDTDAHHDDYSKPLSVRWLCRTHHRQWHREHPSGIDWGVFNVRLDAERRERWEAAAKATGCSLAEFVRQAGDAAEQSVVGGSALAAAVANAKRGTKRGRSTARAPRSEMCVHRVPADQHCKRCDV